MEVQERPRARIADQQFPIPDAERGKLANNCKLTPKATCCKTAGKRTLDSRKTYFACRQEISLLELTENSY